MTFNWLKCLGGIMHLKPTAGCHISTLIFEKKHCGGGLYPHPMKKITRTQSSCQLGAYINGITRAFNWLKCLGLKMHLKLTAGCRISTLIFEIKLWSGWSLLISQEKYIKDGKVLVHLGFMSKVLPGPLTDLSGWVGFCTSSPQQGVEYQLWYLNFFNGGGSP